MTNKLLSPQYVAGLVDGEGCLNFRTDTTMPRLMLGFSYKKHTYQLLEKLKKQYGGSICINNRILVSKHKEWAEQKMWFLSGDGLNKLLNEISSYLFLKREQSNLIKKFLEQKPPVGNRQTFKNKMHKLNKRGRA